MKIMAYFAVGFLCVIILIKIVDPPRFHQVAADWGRKLGYYDFAIDHYSRSIHLNANRAGAFNSRGVTRYHQGQFEHAVGDYNRAIELDPQYALAIKNRALAFLALGKGAEAKRDYELACNLGRCVDVVRLCNDLKLRCETEECTSFETAVKIGLCQVP